MAALTGSQDCLRERLEVFRCRRAALLARMDKAGIPYVRPGGTFYVFMDVRPTGLSSEEFAFALLEREGVFLYPGAYFGERGEGFERISLVVPEDTLVEAVDRIARVFERPR